MADVPASISTTSTIAVGGGITGVLDPATVPDHDWYRISLIAGQTVSITMAGSGADPVEDTYLRLRSSTGAILKFNDDSGGQINVSKIVFTAPTTGTYFIDAGSFDSTSDDWNPDYAPSKYTGTYTVSVETYTAPPAATYDTIANELVNGYWNAFGETARHFDVSKSHTVTYNITALTGAGEASLATAALAEWSDATGITFTPVTTGGQIVFHNSVTSGDAQQAFTDDSVSNGLITQADITITTAWTQAYGTGLDSYSFQTYVHEIGHALGLGHAGNYNGDADYVSDALFANDAWSTSIMSYFSQQDNSYFGNQGFTFAYALTPMDADIVAVQQLYGVPTTTRSGDTTYGFNSNAGSNIYNASVISDAAYTIFDSGGNDTLDYSGFSQKQTINLNPETFSSVGPEVGNVMIARGVVIENAIGGSGNDTIIGNDVANKLIGNAGVDNISGGGGDDFITGGAGIDTLSGGIGNDTFIDTRAGLSGDTITDFSAGDKIVLSDATLAGFTFSLSGSTLTYSGGSLKFGAAVGGTFVTSAAAVGGVQLQLQPKHDAANDFNGDGRSDILWRNDNGGLSDWLGLANGGFQDNAQNAFQSVSTSWHVADTGDFNGDGRDDILWRNDDGRMADWLGQSNGGFLDNSGNGSTSVSTSWHVAATGDFNGDGRDDILWRNDDGRMSDWLGLANGGFQDNGANGSTSVPISWTVAGTGDFNGDGRDDILWRNTNGTIANWLGQANGGFLDNGANGSTWVPTSWHVGGIGDFNGDGRDDILWRNDDGRISDWIGLTNGGFQDNGANGSTTVPTSWHVEAIGDYNGDGRDDILWRNDDGRTTDWLGQSNGGFFDNGVNGSTLVPTTWHAQPAHDSFV